MAESYNRNVFGKVVRERLDQMGWRQHDLAEALGVAQQTVSKWVNGDPPKPANARRVAYVLNLDDNVLLQLLLDDEQAATTGSASDGAVLPGAARSGLDVSDLTPEERRQVEGYIDALRERRQGRDR